jgi:acylphosphatase
MSKSVDEKIGIHCFISGKVQGVWYRASTQDQAKSLGLTGWARNLADGRVEVRAFGERSKLADLHGWLKTGPDLANVSDVSFEEIPFEVHERFTVK